MLRTDPSGKIRTYLCYHGMCDLIIEIFSIKGLLSGTKIRIFIPFVATNCEEQLQSNHI